MRLEVRGVGDQVCFRVIPATIRTSLKKYYKERFEAQRRLARNLAGAMEVNEILEILREEARALISGAMEVCVLLLDPDARRYTRPLQCALFATPVNCLSCKKSRAATSTKRRATV